MGSAKGLRRWWRSWVRGTGRVRCAEDHLAMAATGLWMMGAAKRQHERARFMDRWVRRNSARLARVAEGRATEGT